MSDRPNLHTYIPACRHFLEWLERRPRISISSRKEKPRALTDLLIVERAGSAAGHSAFSAFKAICPEMEGHLGESRRALKGWERVEFAREGAPIPLELVALMRQDWLDRGYVEEADALLAAVDLYIAHPKSKS